GTTEGGATLRGTTTATVSNSVVSFANLSINKAGTRYTLNASSCALSSATSAAFNVTSAGADQLTFGQQPTNTPAGTSISPAVTVQILDAYGNLATGDSSDSVTIGLGTNAGGGSLSGTLTVTAKSGVPSFG